MDKKIIIQKARKSELVRFCVVGSLGFVINFVLLTILFKILGFNIFIAQLISSELALFSNFLFHHHWTYKHRQTTKFLTRLFWEFHATSWAAIIGSTLLVGFGVHTLNLHYTVALIISSFVALGWNFLWTKHYIWKHIDV
jgi:putative flippase GtrA